jgi:hypothetical protein
VLDVRVGAVGFAFVGDLQACAQASEPFLRVAQHVAIAERSAHTIADHGAGAVVASSGHVPGYLHGLAYLACPSTPSPTTSPPSAEWKKKKSELLQAAGEAKESAKETASSVVDKVKEGASNKLNAASGMVKDVPGKTKETTQNLKEVGVEAAKAVVRERVTGFGNNQ